MTTFVLLVRGVTPSGRNKLPMARFREVLEQAGFSHVRTYIQSGNAMVDTNLPAHEVERNVRELIRDQIGPELTVIARTGDQLEAALAANRLQKVTIAPGSFLFLLQNRPPNKRSGSFCPLISPRKYSHLAIILHTCTSRGHMAGGY